jgi:SAM-dependent methyltransferase
MKEHMDLLYTPQFDLADIERDLSALLVSGVLSDRDIDRRIAALADRFRIYTAYYPYGLWAPGVVVTPEMRNVTEFYLPLDEIRRAVGHLFSISIRFSPFIAASTIHNASAWLDALHGLQPHVNSPDPALLLRSLMADGGFRCRFIFANFLPARYGGGFGRYPGQSDFLRRWLGENRPRLNCEVRCLDAACGSGEGTYELALLLLESGFSADSIHVRGVTLEPLELFVATHCCFPCDPRKTAAYRLHTGPLCASGAAGKIRFTLEDITGATPYREREYDIILCNGFLGGPFLHGPGDLLETVRRLSVRLREKGILLAASRFHGGWKKLIPEEALREIFRMCGLRILRVAEGVAGEKEKGEL